VIRILAPLAAALLFLAACSPEETAAIPGPATMTEEAVGHYCQMYVLEHPGPKAQLFLEGVAAPLWFSQVRDAVIYKRSPEKTADIVVIYVSDMGAAPSWEEPGTGNFIRAEDAVFVVGADMAGGMGAPEFVPFAREDDARAFAAEHGGTLMRFDDIPDEAIGEVPAGE
jgi:copper chaperone NosL